MSFHPLPDELKWNDYTGSQVEVDLSRWKFKHDRWMSIHLHNKMNAMTQVIIGKHVLIDNICMTV